MLNPNSSWLNLLNIHLHLPIDGPPYLIPCHLNGRLFNNLKCHELPRGAILYAPQKSVFGLAVSGWAEESFLPFAWLAASLYGPGGVQVFVYDCVLTLGRMWPVPSSCSLHYCTVYFAELQAVFRPNLGRIPFFRASGVSVWNTFQSSEIKRPHASYIGVRWFSCTVFFFRSREDCAWLRWLCVVCVSDWSGLLPQLPSCFAPGVKTCLLPSCWWMRIRAVAAEIVFLFSSSRAICSAVELPPLQEKSKQTLTADRD